MAVAAESFLIIIFNHNLCSEFILFYFLLCYCRCFNCNCSVFQSDSDLVSSILVALESIHAALAVMAHNEMPKQLYKEEVCCLC